MDAVHRLGAAVVSRARGDRARFGAAMAGGIPFGGTSGSTAGSTAGNTAGNTLAFGIVLMILSGLVVRRSLSRVEGRTRTIWTAMGVAGGPAAAAAIILIARRAPEPDQPNPLA
jgi:hypothetical protein